MLNDQYILRGALGTRTYNQIFDLIVNSPEITTLVEQQISGSNHDEINVQTGRLIRKAGLTIHLESTSNIFSGGVDLFISGKRRTMEEGATVGVHSWADDEIEGRDLPADSPIHNEHWAIPYANEMLGAPTGKAFYFFAINAAPADGMYDMSRAEMESFNMLTSDARKTASRHCLLGLRKNMSHYFLHLLPLFNVEHLGFMFIILKLKLI